MPTSDPSDSVPPSDTPARGRRVPPTPGPAAPAAGGPLGRTADFVSPAPDIPRIEASVKRRYALQHIAQKCLPDHRVATCMRQMTGGLVEVLHHPQHGGASFGGLTTCGNGWVCPVCSAKILSRRAEEVSKGAAAWEADGGAMLLVTLTLRHERGVSLSEYLNGLNEAYRLLRQGRAWVDFKRRYGLVGTITRREVTHGAAGWHPHLHALMFLERHPDGEQLAELGAWVKRRWVKVLHKLGFEATEEHGADVRRADAGAAEYIGKMTAQWSVAKEVADASTKSALRGNETIAQLLLRAAEGDAEAVYLYREYAEATRGKALIVWSPGLRATLQMDEEEKTDEEVAAEETSTAIPLIALTRNQWLYIMSWELRGELLAAAAGGDIGQVVVFLSQQGIGIEDWQIGHSIRAKKVHGIE